MKEITLNDGPKRKRRRDRSRTEGSRREGSREERQKIEGLEHAENHDCSKAGEKGTGRLEDMSSSR